MARQTPRLPRSRLSRGLAFAHSVELIVGSNPRLLILAGGVCRLVLISKFSAAWQLPI